MENPRKKTKPFDIRERTLQFAIRILQICSRLPRTPEGNVVRGQLADAGTPVGANAEEADGAHSKLDTRKSYIVSRKEACESRFWLRVAQAMWLGDGSLRDDIEEASELVRIFSSLIARLS